ncbi:uncharacterized protein ACUXCC_000848 [Cytobacillus horneckiae]
MVLPFLSPYYQPTRLYLCSSPTFPHIIDKKMKGVRLKMYYPYAESYRQNPRRIMKVHGNATLDVKPDTATIQLGLITEDEQLSQAQQENAEKMNLVIQSLLQAGIPRSAIQTSTFNIHPRYEFEDGKQIFKGYRVTNDVTVKLKNLEQTGQVIALALQNGANTVSNLQFSISNEEEWYQKALSAAIQNAILKANTIADTLNVNVDSIPVKVIEEQNRFNPVVRTFATAEAAALPPIEPGEITIEAAVAVNFQY